MTKLLLDLTDGSALRKGQFKLADDVTVTAFRNSATSVRFTTNESEDDAAAFVEDKASRVLAWLGDRETLLAHTQVDGSSDEGDSAGVKLKLVGSDVLGSVIDRRRRQAQAAYGQAGSTSRTWTSIDESQIAKDVIDDENTRADTWLRTSSVAIPSTGVLRTVTIEQGKPVREFLIDMANAYDGFDLGVIPTYTAGSKTMGDLGIWTRRGTDRPTIRFRYGTGEKTNITSWIRQVDPSRVTTHQAMLGRDNNRVQVISPLAGTIYNGQFYDSEDSLSDVSETVLLTTLANQYIVWRSSPRELISFVPDPTSGVLPVRDFDWGDQIAVEIIAPRFSVSGLVRVYGWSMTRDNTGAARCSSITISPSDQGAG